MELEVIDHVDTFRANADAWDALVRRAPGGEIFATHVWLDAWWRAFAAPGAELAIACVRDGARIVAALPMQASGRRWSALFNHYSGRTSVLHDPAEPRALTRLFGGLARAHDRWDVIELPWVPEDSDGLAWLRALAPPGLHVHAVRTSESPFLPIEDGSFEAFYTRRFSARTRSRDRQSLRQASDRPGFALDVVRAEALSADALGALLDRMMAVEALGWKGAANSSMVQDPATRRFVRDVTLRLAPEGCVSIVTLSIDGQLAAFVLGLVFGGVYSYYKTSFDPAFEALRPGRIVTTRAIEEAWARGVRCFDFLGAADEYKLRYTDHVRPHATVFLYHRGVRSRLFRAVKRTAVPIAKTLLGRGPTYPVRIDL
ncbi:GNAT family N-acetyltransferase [Myxococcota bacterium]|nr:GNAT family N-acetyltransferase [Myxococcota bacterium]